MGAILLKIHILRCGYISVPPEVPYGSGAGLKSSLSFLLAREKDRVTLPVCAYLVEHSEGLILIDTGLCREISPDGVYDAKAARSVLPSQLVSLFHPYVPRGMAVREQLAAMGLRPEELSCVILTHLDADHTAGLRGVAGAKRIVVPEDEYFWSCRTVYKLRQPDSLWKGIKLERPYYRASSLGPRKWAIDLFGDGSVVLVNLPGHTDGQAAVILSEGGRFLLLAADAAYSERNWKENVCPGLGFDASMQEKSLSWIASMARESACAGVLCSHDPDAPTGALEL